MHCKNCGGEMPVNVNVCPYCDTEIRAVSVAEKKPVKTEEVEKLEKETTSKNPLLGKEYSFCSTRGIRFGFFTQIANKVSVGDDRLFIETTPRKCNDAPSVLFEDIMGITISTKFAFMYILYAFVCLLAGMATGGIALIGVLVFLWIGNNKKIIISQRNGKNITIYSGTKADAEQFKEDMKLVTKIR